MKYLRKSDWGDYWFADPGFSIPKLVERSWSIVARMGLRLDLGKGRASDHGLLGNESSGPVRDGS